MKFSGHSHIIINIYRLTGGHIQRGRTVGKVEGVGATRDSKCRPACVATSIRSQNFPCSRARSQFDRRERRTRIAGQVLIDVRCSLYVQLRGHSYIIVNIHRLTSSHVQRGCAVGDIEGIGATGNNESAPIFQGNAVNNNAVC